LLLHARRHDVPPASPPPAPVRFPDLRGEWRLGREAVRLALAGRAFTRAPHGRGEPVLLVPGWQAPEASLAPLRLLLRRKGYDATPWGLGVNRGQVEAYLEQLVPRLLQLADAHGGPVALVGWSLGGVISRELARECPGAVSCVATFGTPVIGGPTFTVGARAYGPEECERIARVTEERLVAAPLALPLAVIFSRLDTIVSWPACIDRVSPRAVHYEVQSTHLSMGIDPAVWTVILEHLGHYASP
jgi:pimeloyl-ACP methyl ester carboxylesterase